jgi:hypothetical protein
MGRGGFSGRIVRGMRGSSRIITSVGRGLITGRMGIHMRER